MVLLRGARTLTSNSVTNTNSTMGSEINICITTTASIHAAIIITSIMKDLDKRCEEALRSGARNAAAYVERLRSVGVAYSGA